MVYTPLYARNISALVQYLGTTIYTVHFWHVTCNFRSSLDTIQFIKMLWIFIIIKKCFRKICTFIVVANCLTVTFHHKHPYYLQSVCSFSNNIWPRSKPIPQKCMKWLYHVEKVFFFFNRDSIHWTHKTYQFARDLSNYFFCKELSIFCDTCALILTCKTILLIKEWIISLI